MHNNYYFLRHLSTALDDNIRGYQLVEAFSQNKNELILGLSKDTSDFYIKAYLDPSFCCLSFPESFSRARRNSVDLFTLLQNKTVRKVRQFENERCFSIDFEDDFQLLFKMHGNRSNVILFRHNKVEEVFKKSLKKDFDIDPEKLDRSLDQSKSAFINAGGEYTKLFPTFGKVIKPYLQQTGIEAMAPEDCWGLLEQTLQKLAAPQFFIVRLKHQLHLSLLETGEVLEDFNDPVSAINSFFIRYISESTMNSLKQQALAAIHKQLKQNENYIGKTTRKLHEIETQQSHSMLADIIMANLHRIPPKAKEVTLENFYDANSEITIKLKQDLSPQKNAETYYRKAKNQSMEIQALKSNLKRKQQAMDTLIEKQLLVEEASDLRSLRDLLKKDQKDTSSKEQSKRPFHSFKYGGFDIWVGKNARSNDAMLQQHSFKDDLWLHAKDVSGSHVLIKHQAGRSIPKEVIEKAASLAAWNSKRKSDSLCPVIVTPRKYVRKRKGDPPGAVVVDKEQEVILVVPEKD